MTRPAIAPRNRTLMRLAPALLALALAPAAHAQTLTQPYTDPPELVEGYHSGEINYYPVEGQYTLPALPPGGFYDVGHPESFVFGRIILNATGGMIGSAYGTFVADQWPNVYYGYCLIPVNDASIPRPGGGPATIRIVARIVYFVPYYWMGMKMGMEKRYLDYDNTWDEAWIYPRD